MNFGEIAKEVLINEANELLSASAMINEGEFTNIINVIHENTDGKVIVVGIGKSGLVGKKIAATLASTGTPSFFVHPIEAMHGDLGMITKKDIILAISYSGESDELLTAMPHLRRLSYKIITMTRDKNSSISRFGDYFININVSMEACPLNIAPTSSTTLTLAMGDAIAICLMKKRGFKSENFAAFHPGGSLGKRLFVKIKDIMQKDNLPIVSKEITLKDAIIKMTNGKLGSVIIAENNKPIGILSDGDLRRAMIRKDFNLEHKVIDYATTNPKICDNENTLAYEVLRFIENSKIQLLIITDRDNQIKGAIHIHRLIEAGIK